MCYPLGTRLAYGGVFLAFGEGLGTLRSASGLLRIIDQSS